MSAVSTSMVFVCSYCSKAIRFQPSQLGLRIHCPACKRVVQVYPNQNEVVDPLLTTSWFYRQLRLFFGDKEVGPISDADFLSVVRRGEIHAETDVRSPEVTRNEWVQLARINLTLVQEKLDQRIAERTRRERLVERQRLVDKENRDKLRRAIRGFVEDGIFTASEQQAVRQFASSAGISEAEVRQFLMEESVKLILMEISEDWETGKNYLTFTWPAPQNLIQVL